MPFTVEWVIPQRVVLCNITGDLAAEEIVQINAALENHVSTGTAPVHVITNTMQMQKFPVSAGQINKMVGYLRQKNLGWAVIVTPQRVVGFIATVVTGVANVRFKSVNSMESAWQILHRVDASLPATPVEQA